MLRFPFVVPFVYLKVTYCALVDAWEGNSPIQSVVVGAAMFAHVAVNGEPASTGFGPPDTVVGSRRTSANVTGAKGYEESPTAVQAVVDVHDTPASLLYTLPPVGGP